MNQNRIIKISLSGGLLGALLTNPCNTIEKAISKANSEGWRAVQILPYSDSNMAMAILKLIVLCLTMFLWTWGSGYIVLLERLGDQCPESDRHRPIPDSANIDHSSVEHGSKEKPRFREPRGTTTGQQTSDTATQTIADICAKTLGIGPHQLNAKFDSVGVPRHLLDPFFDEVEERMAIFLPPIARDAIESAADLVKFAIGVKR